MTITQEYWSQRITLDCEIAATMTQVSVTPGDYVQWELRRSADNLYKYYIEYAGDIHRLRLRQVFNGVDTLLATDTTYTLPNVTPFSVKAIGSSPVVLTCQVFVGGTWQNVFGGSVTDASASRIIIPGFLSIEAGVTAGAWIIDDFRGGSLNAPTNTGLPTITGSAPIGSILTLNNATWDCDDIVRTYQWTRDGASIAAATGQTYTTVSSDIGHVIGCKETATTTGGGTTATASNTVTVTAGVITGASIAATSSVAGVVSKPPHFTPSTIFATSTVSGRVLNRPAGFIAATSTVSAELSVIRAVVEPDEIGPFAAEVYRQLAPVAGYDNDLGEPLLRYVVANAQMFEDVDALARSNWSILLDLDRVPDNGLPWLGQFLGVVVDTALPVDRQRQQIREHVGWARGRPATLKSAIRPYLSGSKTVDIIERDSSAYHFEVRTFGDETPATTTYDDLYNNFQTYEDLYNQVSSYEQYLMLYDGRYNIEKAIENNKPGGLQFIYTVVPGSPGSFPDYDDLLIHNDTYEDVFDNYQTYDDVYVAP